MIASLDQYQQLAARTIGSDQSLAVWGLGVAGEAGEVAELIKKVVGHGHPLDRNTLVTEIGDVLWYVSAIATTLGVSLSDVAAANIRKLQQRYPDGFSTERSINR